MSLYTKRQYLLTTQDSNLQPTAPAARSANSRYGLIPFLYFEGRVYYEYPHYASIVTFFVNT